MWEEDIAGRGERKAFAGAEESAAGSDSLEVTSVGRQKEGWEFCRTRCYREFI